MPTLTPAQVYELARGAGLGPSEAVVATAIAAAESGLRTDARGDEGIQTDKWGPSIGLWQIRSLKADSGTGRTRDATRLTDPAFNARAMAEISGTGTSWRPWSVYTSGAYRDQLPRVVADTGVVEKRSDTRVPILGDAANLFEDAVDAVTPGNWADDALAIGLKIVVTLAAVGLVVAGAMRGVQGSGK